MQLVHVRCYDMPSKLHMLVIPQSHQYNLLGVSIKLNAITIPPKSRCTIYLGSFFDAVYCSRKQKYRVLAKSNRRIVFWFNF